MLSITGGPDPKREVGNLLKLGIEPRMRKGNAYLHGRKETLRRPDRRSEVGVPGDDDQGVAGVEVKEFDGLHAQGDVGFLFFEALDPPSAVGAGQVLSLEVGDVKMDACLRQCLEIRPESVDDRRIGLQKETWNCSEEVDLFENGIAAEQVEEGTQELGNVEPAEVGGSQCHFGVADREVQIKPIHEKGHSVSQGTFQKKRTPTGRNPWGPRGTPESPWGGMKKVCSQTGARVTKKRLGPPY